MNRIAIIIITYNVPSLINNQVKLIQRYCEDEYDLIVVDNSTDKAAIAAISYYTTQLGVKLLKIKAAEAIGTESNVFACNFAYYKYRNDYDYFLFFDHDTFPLKKFSIIKELDGHIMAGVPQVKSKTYFMQTALIWNNKEIDHALIDFHASAEFGLDTGGMLYRVIEKYGDRCKFFNESYFQNPYFRKGFYNFYSCLNDEMFMHFINSSNWNSTDGNDERINSLINVLIERTKKDDIMS